MIDILEHYSPSTMGKEIIAKGSCPYCKDYVKMVFGYSDEIAFYSCCSGEVAAMVTKAIAAEEKLGGCCKWVIIKDVFDSSFPGFCANHKYIGVNHIMDEPPIVKAAHLALSTGKPVKYAEPMEEDWGTVGYLGSIDMQPTTLSFEPKWIDPLDLEEVKSLVYGQWQEGPSNENPAATINWNADQPDDEAQKLSRQADYLPGVKEYASYPCVCEPKFKNPVSQIIIHLNDYHKWPRERIADWLDEIDDPYGDGPDLAFEVPEGE